MERWGVSYIQCRCPLAHLDRCAVVAPVKCKPIWRSVFRRVSGQAKNTHSLSRTLEEETAEEEAAEKEAAEKEAAEKEAAVFKEAKARGLSAMGSVRYHNEVKRNKELRPQLQVLDQQRTKNQSDDAPPRITLFIAAHGNELITEQPYEFELDSKDITILNCGSGQCGLISLSSLHYVDDITRIIELATRAHDRDTATTMLQVRNLIGPKYKEVSPISSMVVALTTKLVCY